MIYGVFVLYNHENYDKAEMQILKGFNANLMFNGGAEAIFMCESDAFAYAYEQSEKRKMLFNRKVCDFNAQ